MLVFQSKVCFLLDFMRHCKIVHDLLGTVLVVKQPLQRFFNIKTYICLEMELDSLSVSVEKY